MLDVEPLFRGELLDSLRWLVRYTHAPAGEVFATALPGLPTGSCSVSAPCDLIWVERFGFVTIPVMALAGFLAILTLLFAYAGRGDDTETEISS